MKPLLSTLSLLLFYSISMAQTIQWKRHIDSQGAFSVEFPGEPKISETINKSPEGYDVKVKMFVFQEQSNVCYVMYNEMEAGINIMDDTLYLNTVTDHIIEKFGREASVKENIRFENFPGKHFLVEFPDGIAEGKIILRTNRAYFVVSFFPKTQQSVRKKFLESFHLLPYQKRPTVSYQSPDHFFKMDFPSKPKLSTETNDETVLYAYYALDPSSGNNFSVAVDKYSPYVQFKNDSSVLANRVQGYTLGGDSLISIQDVIVDGRPGKDLIIHQGTNNFKMRVRLFTNGNYSYTIFTFLPIDEIRAPHVNQFFNSFRFTARVPGNLLSDKSELMLKDIESNDTTILKAVFPAIDAHTFKDEHLPKIQALLLKQFDDDADTLSSRKLILLQALGEIESPTSVEFIRRLFPTLKGNPELEFNAIDVLVRLNTPDANDLIAEFLPIHTEVKGDIWKYSRVFSYSRIDSASVKDYFFKVVPLISRPSFKTGLYSFMQQMLRNKKIQFPDVATHKQTILSDFKSQFEGYKKDTIYQYLDDLTIIVAYDKPGKNELEILKKLSGDENDYLAIHANASLLRQQQKQNDKRVEAIAKDQYFRKDLFNEYNDFQLGKFFPKAYYRQDSIALSELYSYVSDEYVAPTAIRVVHTEILDYHGEKKRFFVIQFMDPEDELTYRGVAGPYSPDKLEVFAELTGSFFEEDREESHHYYLMDYIARFEED